MRIPPLVSIALLLAAAAPLARGAAQVGETYCFGNSCPCGNDDPFSGCANLGSDGWNFTGGGLEVVSGSDYACADDLVLRAYDLASNKSALLFMGAAPLELPFGDGKLCIGAGGVGIFRYGVHTTDSSGTILETNIVSRSQSFASGGRIRGGSTWYFQVWYRDPGGPCASAFNTTNALVVTFLPHAGGPGEGTPLAGNPLPQYPWFHYVTSFNQGSNLHLAVDPLLHPEVQGLTADVYVLFDRDEEDWESDPSLVDVRGAPTVVTFSGGNVQTNTFVIDAGTLNGTAGNRVGIGYDLVVDLDRDGVLDASDLIDGLPQGAGFYVVRDTQAVGPYATMEALYSGGSWLGQDTYWPANIASLGKLPLLVVSHGNGHNYQWYDHIGEHMASYGYVVMSHQNNTMPGIETASTTTLTNTDYLLGNLSTILGGVLDGHVDGDEILWMGHSRGGEGVTRAYDRLFDGTYVPTNYSIEDIQLVSSIAPTDFQGTNGANPHGVDYHLWTGSADADVDGSPGCDICQTYHLLERAVGRRASITLQGAGHGAFHDGGGSTVASGPCQILRPTTHSIMKGYLLPLARYFVDDDPASRDFLWRQWEEFHPIGAPISDPCAIVNLELRESPGSFDLVVHDWESGGGGESSSGGAVTWTVTNLVEGSFNDANQTFTWEPSDPMNGMTRARAADSTHGAAFDWQGPAYLELEILPCERDLTDNGWLSFRACQGTRHPDTTAVLEDLTFSVTLRDTHGTTSTISIAAYGGGIEEPYQRAGAGIGAGWGNEFETVAIRLTDFLANGSGLDPTSVEAIRFEFGLPGDSPVGRLGLDDVELSLR